MSKTTQAVKLSRDRILAIVLAAVSLIALFLPHIVVKNNGGSYTAETGLLFSGFGGTMEKAGLVSIICISLMMLSMLASIALNVIGFLREEDGETLPFVRIASLVVSAGAGFYALAVSTLSGYVAGVKTQFDLAAFLVALVGVAIYAWLLIEEFKRDIFKPAAQYGLTLLSTILLAAAITLQDTPETANIIHVALLVLAFAGLVFSQFCLMKKFESPLVDRIRFIAQLAIALIFAIVCLFTLGIQSFIFAFIGAIVVAVPVAELFLNVNEEEPAAKEYAYSEYTANEEEEYGDNEEEPEMFPSIPRSQMVGEPEMFPSIPRPTAEQDQPIEETAETPCKKHVVQAYAEAYAYEGGPVAGVELAEEINPAFTGAQTAGYDFYNCQSFDPFIASLNQEERNQFTELFILRYKGVMPEIPDYVVGGDNSEFFRMIFIYLGQYRERIPNGLLNKIYIYSTKIS